MTTIKAERYRYPKGRLGHWMVAGFIATIFMLTITSIFHFLRAPAPSYGVLLGKLFTFDPVPELLSGAWWGGVGLLFLFGTVILPLLFRSLSRYMNLSESGAIQGTLFGFCVGLSVCVVVAPMAGAGVFFRSLPMAAWLTTTTILGWWFYGITLEGLSREEAALEEQVEIPQPPLKKRAA